ncbi:MAG: helix-turn-helix domain-containing protein [Desulfuromonadales bacterium]|nr:helix-turn-helix domain-containing protein [Desulfuromonadales bacterium]
MSTSNQHNVGEILRRLMFLKKYDTYQEVADFLEVDNRTLSAWKQRNSKVAVQKISAKCADLDLNWLLTGEGEMRQEGRASTPVDADVLEAVIEAVEVCLGQVEGSLKPAKKAQLIATLYGIVNADAEKKIEEGKVMQLVRLAL